MIDISRLEQAVAGRAADCGQQLLTAVFALARGERLSNDLPDDCRRLANVLTGLLADPEIELAPDVLQRLTVAGAAIANALAIAGGPVATQADHVARAHGARGAPLLRLDAPGFAPEAVFDLPPPFNLLAACALVCAAPIQTLAGEAARERLISQSDRLEGAQSPLTRTAFGLVCAAWMFCSYGMSADRHRLKPVLNGILKDALERLEMVDPPLAERTASSRPTMLVMAEVIHAAHVQFRYFGQYLRQLRTRFRLVLVTPKDQISGPVEALFDEVFTFDPTAPSHVGEVVGFAAALRPDVCFWPSVGMARWGPLIANLRLAPVQITALGHSASTFIPAMDYYLTEEGYVGDPDLFSETLLLLPDESLRFEPRPGFAAPAPVLREHPQTVRIAVPSNIVKLRPSFLATLGRVRRACSRPLEFDLFPNCTALEGAALGRAAEQLVGPARIYLRLAPNDYLAALNACDLVLSPFPFGGLHSVVDSLRQGLPVIAREGAEPHARTDAMILRRLGLPESWIARDEDGYVAAALRLIEDDAARIEASRLALAAGVEGRLFAAPNGALRDEVVDAVWAAWQGHEAIQASGRKVWRLDELRGLQAVS